MRNTSGIYWRRGVPAVSLVWQLHEDGSPEHLTIMPHRGTGWRMIFFRNGRREMELGDLNAANPQLKKFGKEEAA